MIKKITPLRIKKHPKIQIIRKKINIYREFIYDAKIYLKYSNSFDDDSNQKKLLASIIRQYHIVEKGLAMPNMKFGFGTEVLKQLVGKCIEFSKKYDITNDQYRHALGVLLEYKSVHENSNEIDGKIINKINEALLIGGNIKMTNQILFTKEEYFSKINEPFNLFAESRKSVRSFSGEVDVNKIKNAIYLAQTAPSACNRQPSHVYVIINEEIKKNILSIQRGNRGFGHLADKLLVVTTELAGYRAPVERNGAFVDGGIYAMNLLYSLHFYKVGAVILNWSSTHLEDEKIRNLINSPESERIILIIACGDIPEKFKCTLSKRNDIKKVVKII